MVISLHINKSLFGKFFLISSIILKNLIGEIKKTTEQPILETFSNSLISSPFFSGKNPIKIYLSVIPLTESAELTAYAPGIWYMFILFFMHSLISIFPGSEIAGVPASEIKDTILFFLKFQ